MTILYENIQKTRKQQNIKSIRQLEESSGVPVGTIKRWKEKSSKAIEAFVKLSIFLGCSVDCLTKENHNHKAIDEIVFELEKHNVDDVSASLIIDMIQVIMAKRDQV